MSNSAPYSTRLRSNLENPQQAGTPSSRGRSGVPNTASASGIGNGRGIAKPTSTPRGNARGGPVALVQAGRGGGIFAGPASFSLPNMNGMNMAHSAEQSEMEMDPDADSDGGLNSSVPQHTSYDPSETQPGFGTSSVAPVPLPNFDHVFAATYSGWNSAESAGPASSKKRKHSTISGADDGEERRRAANMRRLDSFQASQASSSSSPAPPDLSIHSFPTARTSSPASVGHIPLAAPSTAALVAYAPAPVRLAHTSMGDPLKEPSPSGAEGKIISRWPPPALERTHLTMVWVGSHFALVNPYPNITERDAILFESWLKANRGFTGNSVIIWDSVIELGLQSQLCNIRSRYKDAVHKLVVRLLLVDGHTPQRLLQGGIFHYAQVRPAKVQPSAGDIVYEGVGRPLTHEIVIAVLRHMIFTDRARTESMAVQMPERFEDGIPDAAYAWALTQIQYALEAMIVPYTLALDGKFQFVYNNWKKTITDDYFNAPRRRVRMTQLRAAHWEGLCSEMHVASSATGTVQTESCDTDDEA
ncbi:hypothetical protein EXIGLDRAFT_719951 [Exidia glandulosa HHB12029]|uniref:DUF6532 domain-containing protein n=1 Tax=Exidia glandulosa HHB12029 TaxID=1314781 RepID=A0A165GPR6_EXIGL|nr:hypothetical protein EXIGLDRAFT_719951 [Exidia glandulosa HHB12029]